MQAVLEVRRVSKAFDRRNADPQGRLVLPGARRDGGADRRLRLRQVDPDPGDRRAGPDRQGQCRRPRFRAGASDCDAGAPGEIILFGQPMQRDGRIIGAAKQLRVRIGVIFQQFNLVPRLSVLTNVCLGLLGRVPFLQGTHRPLQRSRREAPRHAGARPRRHCRARAQARLASFPAASSSAPPSPAPSCRAPSSSSPTSRSPRSIRIPRAASWTSWPT